MRFLVKVSVVSASSTRRPLIRSSTSRAFCGDTRVNRAFAVNSMSLTLCSQSLLFRRRRCSWCGRSRTTRNTRGLGGNFRCRLHRVTFEDPRKGELTQLVSHHVFRDVHRNKFFAVVHRNGVSHHLGRNRRTA